jgi:hypothetical protein
VIFGETAMLYTTLIPFTADRRPKWPLVHSRSLLHPKLSFLIIWMQQSLYLVNLHHYKRYVIEGFAKSSDKIVYFIYFHVFIDYWYHVTEKTSSRFFQFKTCNWQWLCQWHRPMPLTTWF